MWGEVEILSGVISARDRMKKSKWKDMVDSEYAIYGV